MSDERAPLPRWGRVGGGLFAFGVIVASTSTILDLRDSGAAWWNATRMVVAVAQLIGLVLWLIAIVIRRRAERSKPDIRR